MVCPRGIVFRAPGSQRSLFPLLDFERGRRNHVVPGCEAAFPLPVQAGQRTVLLLQPLAERAQGVRAEAIIHRRDKGPKRWLIPQIVKKRPVRSLPAHLGSDPGGNCFPKCRIVQTRLPRQKAFVARGRISIPVALIQTVSLVQEGQLGNHVLHIKTQAGRAETSAIRIGALVRGVTRFPDAVEPGSGLRLSQAP